MNSYRNRQRKPVTELLAIAILCISLVVLQGAPVSANDKMEADQLVEKASLAFQSFMCDENMEAFRSLIRDAKGVMIIPSLVEGAFIVGASGGNGVLFARDSLDGDWRGPAFYTIGGASVGLQAGGQSSEVILLAMTDRGVTSFLGNAFKLGGDVGVAIGPAGIGASAATANLSTDIVSFSRSKGLYGGISLDGSMVTVMEGLNRAYFMGNPSPTDILIRHTVSNPQSNMLAGSIAKAANTWVTEVSKSRCAAVGGAEAPSGLALRN